MNAESPISHSRLQPGFRPIYRPRALKVPFVLHCQATRCIILTKPKLQTSSICCQKSCLQLRSFGTNSDNKSRNRNIFNDQEMQSGIIFHHILYISIYKIRIRIQLLIQKNQISFSQEKFLNIILLFNIICGYLIPFLSAVQNI